LYAPGGAAADSLAGTAVRQEEASARDERTGRRALFWLRVVFGITMPLLFALIAVGLIMKTEKGRTALNIPYLAGLHAFATGLSATALAVLLLCWRPARWVPQLRSTINPCAIFAGVASVGGLLGVTGTTDSSGGGHVNGYASLSFVPAAVMSAGVLVLLYVSYRLHPDARKTLYQEYKYNKRQAAELRAREARNARTPGTGAGGGGRE